jgi:hypothetical protein
MADEDLKAELERLKAENEALKKRRSSAVSMKVSEKGAVSVYGLGRFPVTLYQEQWNKLLSMADEIKQFIADNQDKLKVKEGLKAFGIKTARPAVPVYESPTTRQQRFSRARRVSFQRAGRRD